MRLSPEQMKAARAIRRKATAQHKALLQLVKSLEVNAELCSSHGFAHEYDNVGWTIQHVREAIKGIELVSDLQQSGGY